MHIVLRLAIFVVFVRVSLFARISFLSEAKKLDNSVESKKAKREMIKNCKELIKKAKVEEEFA